MMIPSNQSPSLNELVAALAKAQSVIVPPERNRTVRVVPRSGAGAYSFKYATLSAIIEAIRKPFSKYGLWFTQVILYDAVLNVYKVRTTLHHYSGQYIYSEVPVIAEGSSNQQFGSALTYMKRYALSALIGLAADEDDDGNIADGNEIVSAQEKGAKTVAPDVIVKPDANGRIPVPVLADGSGSDWMAFGKNYMALIRSCVTVEGMDALEGLHAAALKELQDKAPKIYTNVMLAMIKIRKELNNAQ